MYTVGTAYGANVQGDKTICLRTVFIVWESINKLKKKKQYENVLWNICFSYCLFFDVWFSSEFHL